MKKYIIILLLIFPSITYCQCKFYINNPSFEGQPQADFPPPGWTICMPNQTPDTQPGFFGVHKSPTDGNSYLGLVTNPYISWQEGVSQKLIIPMIPSINYTMLVDLAASSSGNGSINPGCIELEVWGGYRDCDANTLLWKSDTVIMYDIWETDTISFIVSQPFTYIMFRSHTLGCNPPGFSGVGDQPYILVDNIRPISQPTQITEEIKNPTCVGSSDGKIIISAIGFNPPFTYKWNNSNVTDSILTNISAGSYIVSVTDSLGCLVNKRINVYNPDSIEINIFTAYPLCHGDSNGSIGIITKNSTPPTKIYCNGVLDDGLIENLPKGTYKIDLIDSNGCRATKNVFLNEPDSVYISEVIYPFTCNRASIFARVIGGFPPYKYYWEGNREENQNNTLDDLGNGEYFVVVKDINDCYTYKNITIDTLKNCNIFVPNSFTPNGDGWNDFFEIYGEKSLIRGIDIKIFDRWGEKIYETENAYFKWNGEYKGDIIKPQVVTCVGYMIFSNGSSENIKKSVMVIR